MKLSAVGFLLLMGCSGCGAGFYSASTKASVQISPDGTKAIVYDSNKELNGLDASWTEGTTVIHVKVDKAGTSEAAIAAALQTQLELTKILQTLVPLLMEAAKIGATKVP